MQATAYKHITIDDKGVARIDGTRMKVIHVAEDLIANNSTPQQMQANWPDLSLAQIHAALAYYYDHKAELDNQIQESLARYQAAREASLNDPSPTREKLLKFLKRP
jgi:uncharacterized protein (DUF433 family)